LGHLATERPSCQRSRSDFSKLIFIYLIFKKKGINMKNILVALTLMIFSTSAFAGSCPMMAGKVKSKIEQAQKLHDAGVKAHSDGNHGKSEELLNKALDLFKS